MRPSRTFLQLCGIACNSTTVTFIHENIKRTLSHKLFKALIGPSLIAESTGIEPDPDINRTHCLAGNRYHHQALLSKNEGVGLSY